MSLLPSKEKYIMFLEDKYLIKHIFKSVYNKIMKRLKNKGIVLLIETAEPNEDNKKTYSSLKTADLREYFGEICLFRFLVAEIIFYIL